MPPPRVLHLWPLALALAAPAHALDTALYATLLERHTREVASLARTAVDYPAIRKSADWKRLVASLEATQPSQLASRDTKLAFWINAYNIFAIDLVARNFPVDSIRDIGSFFSPVWKKDVGKVGGRSVTLDQIEHEIIRPMGDPRTHAAVICASRSCPALRREPFTPAQLDAQLDDAARIWIADPDKGLRIERDRNLVTLSKIFDWFPEDFEAAGGALAFATRYAPESERAWLRSKGDGARIAYFDYDWDVNALPR